MTQVQLFFILSLLPICIARLLSEGVVVVEEKLSPPSFENPSDESATDNCEVHGNPSLHLIMDRVCEVCHEMVSHQQPNMRATCRSNCFRNDQFRACLKLFTPHRPSRHQARF